MFNRFANTQCYATYNDRDRVGVVTIYDQLGVDDKGNGLRGSWLAEQLMWLDSLSNVDRIQLRINSPGGNIMEGMSIMAAASFCTKPIDTYCDGVCASMAAIILQAGTKRYIADAGLLMFHAPSMPDGEEQDASLDYFKWSLSTTLATRAGLDQTTIDGLLGTNNRWMDATEALALNLVDASFELANKPTVKTRDLTSVYGSFQQVINQANLQLQPTLDNMNKFEKAAAALKLPADSSDDAFTTAINQLVNTNTTLQATLTETETKLVQAEAKAKELEAVNLDAKVEQLIGGAVAEGRLAATAVDAFKAMAKTNFESAKTAIDALPINKAAVHIPQNGAQAAAQIPGGSAAAYAMAEIRAKNQAK